MSLVAAGRENQQQLRNMQQQQQQQTAPESKKRKTARKGLLGGVLDRFQRSSTSSRSTSPTTTTADLLEDVQHQLGVSVSVSNANNNNKSDDFVKRQEDESLSTVQSDTETSAPISDVEDEIESADHASSSESAPLRIQPRGQHTAASVLILQALFRGYRQRYAFQMMKLRHKLQQIEDLKARQLAKLAHRTRTAKKAEKSGTEFRMEKRSRRLMRTTRVIPFLFREAQTKLQENVQLLTSISSTGSTRRRQQQHQYLQDLQASHMSLQIIAHDYLDCMEDIPGVWEVLKAQWMGPPKPRVRRGFGPTGKVIKLTSNTNNSKASNRPPNDPTNGTDKEDKGQEGLAMMAELYLSRTKQVGESVALVEAMAAGTLWN